MNALLFKKRNCAKFDYEIKVHHLMKLPKSGIILYITWKRGKKHSGETKKTFVKDKIAIWEETFKLKGTLFKNAKGKFKKKYLNLCFQEVVKDKKSKGFIGEVNLNLADFSSQQQENFSTTKTIPVNLWNSNEAQFKFTIKSSLRKGNNSGVDTAISENTTMTDASDDENDEEDPFNEDQSPMGKMHAGKRSSVAMSPISHRSYLERKRNLQEKLSKLNTKNEESGGLSDEEDDKSPKSSGVTSPKSDGIERRKIAQARKRGAKQRRDENASFSLEDDKDPFTTAISDMETPRTVPKIKRSIKQESNSSEEENEKSSDDNIPKNARETISLQEQKMKQMREEIERLQKETNERIILDSLINNRQPEFYENLPLAAPIIFKILQHWDCFSSNKSDFPNKIYNAIRVIVENNNENNELLCYWLNNCYIMLNLMQKEYPVSLETHMRNDDKENIKLNIPQDPNITTVKLTGIASQLQTTQNNTTVGDDEFAFENPVAKFKTEMISLSTKIFARLVENIYKTLIPVLIPAMFQTSLVNGNKQPLLPRTITIILDQYYSLMVKNFIHKDLISQFFKQVYFFINSHTFNALFDIQNKRCKMGSAIMLKMAVSELEAWADRNKIETCKEQLVSLRQASDIMIMNKSSLVDEATRREVCPTLSLIQVRKILQMYHPDDFDPDTVPSSVLKALPTLDLSKKGTDKPEMDTSIFFKPIFDLDIEIPNWKKVKTPKLTGEMFAFLN